MEHESKYLCSACLARLEDKAEEKPLRGLLARAILPVLVGAAFLCAWFFFYLVGQSLLRIKGS